MKVQGAMTEPSVTVELTEKEIRLLCRAVVRDAREKDSWYVFNTMSELWNAVGIYNAEDVVA